MRNPNTRGDVLGLLLVAAGSVRVPARCWPLEVALEELARALKPDYRLNEVLSSWPRTPCSSGTTFDGVDSLLRDLAVAQRVRREGRGWEAGYRLAPAGQSDYFRQLARLPDCEAKAVYQASQRLRASLRTWSNSFVDSLPSGSATS